jgi:ABC-type molybdate transport system ATPase subunit
MQSVAEIVGIENGFPVLSKVLTVMLRRLPSMAQILYAKGEFRIGVRVIVCVRADDVSLDQINSRAKKRNRFEGKIVEASLSVSHHRIAVDCGSFHLKALVGRKKSLDRIPSNGDAVTATFGPEAVHVIRDD